MAHQSDVTGLLLAWSGGEEGAAGALMDAVYDELRRPAGSFLLRERRDHSLAATALVNEAYLKPVHDPRGRHWPTGVAPAVDRIVWSDN
jgi:hypothetical protein